MALPELVHRYRPQRFKDMVGQDKAVAQLTAMVKDNKVPHALLLTGPPGVGKTTAARILRKALGCGDDNFDYREINVADVRGIDSVRDIADESKLSPMGRCRLYVFDECFAAGTVITTIHGTTLIEQIRVGDVVKNLSGHGEVTAAFTNRVGLDRVVKLTFDSGRVIFTTKQHLFLTSDGWVSAGDLHPDHVIPSHVLWQRSNDHNGEKAERHRIQKMPVVRGEVSTDGEKKSGLLLQGLCVVPESCRERSRSNGHGEVSVVSERLSGSGVTHEGVLQPILCRQGEEFAAGVPSQSVHRTSQREAESNTQTTRQNTSRKSSFAGVVDTNDHEQSQQSSRGHRQNEGYQGEERRPACVEGTAGREWNDHSTTTQGPSNAGRESGGVGNGPTRADKNAATFRLPHELQTRRRESSTQDRCRGRWEEPQVEKGYVARCQKDQLSTETRVVSVEVYQPGRNDQLFVGAVTDRDRHRGYVEFYDLEVSGHPSYFANGLPVHNCHRWTRDSQEAMLKILEDTPEEAYFVLCSTDPQKLLPTILSRCTQVNFVKVPDKDIVALISRVVEQENATLTLEVGDAIVSAADGSPRKALVILHQVLGLSPDQRLAAVEKADYKHKSIELCRVLMNPKVKWTEVTAIVGDLEEEPESLRWMVLNYAAAVMLNKPSGRLYAIINSFESHFRDSGKAGLLAACWRVVQNKD